MKLKKIFAQAMANNFQKNFYTFKVEKIYDANQCR
jgi:hypothetical protein